MNIDRFALGRLTNPFYRPGETGSNSLGGIKIEKREFSRFADGMKKTRFWMMTLIMIRWYMVLGKINNDILNCNT